MSLRTEAIRLPSKLAYCVSNQVPHERRSRRDQTSKPLESALSSHGRPLSRSSALADTWEKLLKWRDFHEHASAGVRPSWRVEDVVLLCRFPHDMEPARPLASKSSRTPPEIHSPAARAHRGLHHRCTTAPGQKRFGAGRAC